MIFFLVKHHENSNVYVICNAFDREGAKRKAFDWIGADPDKYIITPITSQGDRVCMNVTVSL